MKKRERNSFLTPLVVEVMPSGKQFRLFCQFTYRWKYRGLVIVITVPAGFVTDFASIPRIFRIIIPKLGKWTKSAVVHDYLYQFGGLSRKQADLCFLDGMKDLGVVKWKRWVMWAAVRVAGGFAWKDR